jgi:hypothetical protein
MMRRIRVLEICGGFFARFCRWRVSGCGKTLPIFAKQIHLSFRPAGAE